MEENDWIALLRARDPRGMEELLRRCGPLMRYVISPILPDAQDQEECLSETAMRVWDKIALYDPARGSIRSWLTALNYLRSRRRQGDIREITEEEPSREPGPEEIVLLRERQAALRRTLDALPEKDRVLFYRKYYYLQSDAQIAAELGVTERSVEGRLYRLRRRLRKTLGGEEHV
ncbi:MAG: RNA polymerase sigma factor [Eubacteriales bacterium]